MFRTKIDAFEASQNCKLYCKSFIILFTISQALEVGESRTFWKVSKLKKNSIPDTQILQFWLQGYQYNRRNYMDNRQCNLVGMDSFQDFLHNPMYRILDNLRGWNKYQCIAWILPYTFASTKIVVFWNYSPNYWEYPFIFFNIDRNRCTWTFPGFAWTSFHQEFKIVLER